MASGISVIDPGGVDRTLTGIQVIDPNGTDRTVRSINIIGPDGVDRLVWGAAAGALAASVTPATAGGIARGTGSATTGTVTAYASGGTAPYTFSWAATAYDNVVAPTATAPGAATTSFTQTNIGRQEDYSATFTVTVHDSATGVATATVAASWADVSGGFHA
jgi:hypothetical protein